MCIFLSSILRSPHVDLAYAASDDDSDIHRGSKRKKEKTTPERYDKEKLDRFLTASAEKAEVEILKLKQEMSLAKAKMRLEYHQAGLEWVDE